MNDQEIELSQLLAENEKLKADLTDAVSRSDLLKWLDEQASIANKDCIAKGSLRNPSSGRFDLAVRAAQFVEGMPNV